MNNFYHSHVTSSVIIWIVKAVIKILEIMQKVGCQDVVCHMTWCHMTWCHISSYIHDCICQEVIWLQTVQPRIQLIFWVVGSETERTIKERFLEHKNYVNANNQSKSTGAHFNEKGHTVSDMEITVIEKVYNQDPRYRKQREKFYIQQFNTRYKGLNRINGGWKLPIATCF